MLAAKNGLTNGRHTLVRVFLPKLFYINQWSLTVLGREPFSTARGCNGTCETAASRVTWKWLKKQSMVSLGAEKITHQDVYKHCPLSFPRDMAWLYFSSPCIGPEEWLDSMTVLGSDRGSNKERAFTTGRERWLVSHPARLQNQRFTHTTWTVLPDSLKKSCKCNKDTKFQMNYLNHFFLANLNCSIFLCRNFRFIILK